MYGEVWTSTWTAMKWALTEALEGVRWAHFKTIHLLGASQLAFPFFLGQYFNRNTSANLFCTNIDGHTFTNQGQPRHGPLEKGNPHCDMPHPEVPPLPEQGQFNSISLLLSKPYLVTPVCQYLRDYGESPPLVWVKHEHFDDNQQVMSYISDIVALLMHLNTKYGVRTIYLFCGLPFHVVPLLAANLLHVVEEVTFMEYRRDLQGTEMPPGEMYVALQTKTRGEVS
jgi:hypothetical protein